MDKVIAVKNFISFAIPLSVLLVCKVVLPTNMYESVVNYTADTLFIPPPNNRGMCTMYEKSINPRKFLIWTTNSLQGIKSTFSSMMLEIGCTSYVGSYIDEEIEFIDYKTLEPKKISDFNIPEDEKTPGMAIDQAKPIVLNIGSTS